MKKLTARDRRLLVLYGITSAEYDAVLRFQGGRCAVCRRLPKRIRLGVDHRHSDGLTRGFLCMRCNKALAYLSDDPDSVRRLGDYLDSPPVIEALGWTRYGRTGRSTRKWRSKKERCERMAAVAVLVANADR